MAFNLVLVEPEIPQNTGNIARTCAATGSVLHLVRPLGFEINDARLKRAGLDYWHLLKILHYDGIDGFFRQNPDSRFWLFTTKGKKTHSDAEYKDNDFLIFGRETRGLPSELLKKHPDRCVRIPMISGARSLNLSNSVAVGVYEALRQARFLGIEEP